MKKVENYARFMLDSGLIFEINRKVLHPLGLALYIDISEENQKWVTIGGLFKTDDKEGFIFDEETFQVGIEKYNQFLQKEGSQALKNRNDALGFIIQEIISNETHETQEK